MWNFNGLKILVLFCVVAGLSGCKEGGKSSQKSKTINDKDTSGIVAKVGDQVISLKDFENHINQQNPLVRSRYQSNDQKQKLLDSLVEREAMVLEAKRLGLDQDPEVQRGIKKILARHLVNAEFNKKRVKEIDVTDEQISAYYQENYARYHSPDKVRAHHIFIAAPKADKAQRSQGKKKAKDLFKQLKANPKDRRFFMQLARENSDDVATKQVGGDTNFKTKEQLVSEYSQTFAEKAFGLKKANDLSNVFSDDKGFYILRQSGKQSAIDLPIEKVKGQIRTTLFARARGDAYKAFVDEIKNKVGVHVFAEIMKSAKIDTGNSGKKTPPGMPNSLGPPGREGQRPPKMMPPGLKIKRKPGK